MRTRRLGRTAIDVTELGFGASGIGNLSYAQTDDAAAAAVESAWNHGIRLFDTAPHYGLGLSERRLGAALAGLPRAEFVVSTKVGRLLRPNPVPTGSDLERGGFDVPDDQTRVWDLTADGIRRSLEESLDRLKLDRVDIVYLHDPDHVVDQAIMEAIPALISLREQGVVGAVGVGMNQWQAPLRIITETDIDVVMLAGRWTLLDRSGQQLLDKCVSRGVAIAAAAPFNSGILARPWPPDEARYDYGIAPDTVLQRARQLAEACDAAATSLPAAALQFPLRHPAVATVVVGMRSAGHVTSAVAGMSSAISEDLWQSLG
ncbi:aldo/keto reductase [Catelliglobosispora koreensis]|uniref:aldo/keto reductase n=1 Tax=Catelliglobosispora koreensis TaxID=129052 RepID=UPI000368BB49|nr:aldo/keto reductase [Catelliglobosispora koreensis]